MVAMHSAHKYHKGEGVRGGALKDRGFEREGDKDWKIGRRESEGKREKRE